jgi:hypothetical protein
MKNIRTFGVAALALLAVGILFSFKNDQVTKEYGTIQFAETNRKEAIIVHLGEEIKSISTESYYDEKKFLTVLNQYTADGWSIVSTDYTSTGAFTKRIVYMQRIK